MGTEAASRAQTAVLGHKRPIQGSSDQHPDGTGLVVRQQRGKCRRPARRYPKRLLDFIKPGDVTFHDRGQYLGLGEVESQKMKLQLSGKESSLIRAMTTILGFCIYGYAAAVIGVLVLLRFSGDRWWFATVLLYGPRWIYALPLTVLVPIAVLLRRRWLGPLGLSALIIAWPIMGWNVPWKGLGSRETKATFRVLTYNIQRWEVSGEEFSKLLDEVDPDFAAVQECAPSRWNISPKWHVQRARTSIVVSRYPILRVETSEREPDVNGIYCVIDTPAGPVGFACVDLLTPRRALSIMLDSEKVFNLAQTEHAQTRIDQRWRESENLSNWLSRFPEPKIICGDFNLTVDSTIYRKYWSEYQNAFSMTEFGYGHTKRTKINIFRYTSRIDHILSTGHFRPTRCWTGPDFGSDHLPLVADIDFQ